MAALEHQSARTQQGQNESILALEAQLKEAGAGMASLQEKLDAEGAAHLLDTRSWRQRRDRLFELGGPPEK